MPILAIADNNSEKPAAKSERYIQFVYNKLSFKKINKLKYETFSKALYGYLNLKEAGKIRGNAILTVCDFSLSSNTKRMWVIDLAKKKVLFNNLVAHGMGSGEEFATKFSNIEDSHQSSLGFYVTGETYMGDNGYSLKLHGVDGSWNSKAYDRAIVVHGADYVNADFANANNRLGRSHGCPALPRNLTEPIISKIANGHVLFIFHPTKQYLKSSFWLNNRIAQLPQESNFLDLIMPEPKQNNWAQKAKPNDSLIIKDNKNRIVSLTATDVSDSTNLNVLIAQQQAYLKDSILNVAVNPVKAMPNSIQTPQPQKPNTEKPKTAVRDKEFLYLKF
jgi:hypothetical protein